MVLNSFETMGASDDRFETFSEKGMVVYYQYGFLMKHNCCSYMEAK